MKEVRYSQTRTVEVVDAKPATTKISTLDDIEDKIAFLANTESNDPLVIMMNEKKIGMLEKLANIKMKRLQLQSLEKPAEIEEVLPIAVRFENSTSDEQNDRLERIDQNILDKRTVKQDA